MALDVAVEKLDIREVARRIHMSVPLVENKHRLSPLVIGSSLVPDDLKPGEDD